MSCVACASSLVLAPRPSALLKSQGGSEGSGSGRLVTRRRKAAAAGRGPAAAAATALQDAQAWLDQAVKVALFCTQQDPALAALSCSVFVAPTNDNLIRMILATLSLQQQSCSMDAALVDAFVAEEPYPSICKAVHSFFEDCAYYCYHIKLPPFAAAGSPFSSSSAGSSPRGSGSRRSSFGEPTPDAASSSSCSSEGAGSSTEGNNRHACLIHQMLATYI